MIGDSRHLPLKDQSVNCIITSPPYWSLRKYDIPDLVWDGEKGCEHTWGNEIEGKILRGTDTGPRKEVFKDIHLPGSAFCVRCSAWRGQLGLEPTIDLYLKHLLQIMDECWRVLRDDGTLWVNLGDSYSGSMKGYMANGEAVGSDKQKTVRGSIGTPPTKDCGIPPKSLCLIPERFAIEMVNRGWILRNKIVWWKRNCMPSSAKDRFTMDWESVFFFVKSRRYYFEQQFDELSPLTIADKRNETGRHTQGEKWGSKYSKDENLEPSWYRSKTFVNSNQGRNKRCVWDVVTTGKRVKNNQRVLFP